MNRIYYICTILSIFTFISCSSSKSADGDAGSDARLTAALDSILDKRYPDADNAPGAAVLIARDGTPVYERYIGVADMDSGEKITENTLFNIASVSKQFTVAALLQQPGLDIDSPASDFFDYPRDFWHKITLRHLASHTSGIPDSRDRSDRNRCVFADEEASISYFPTVDSLKFAPGTAYDYLNPSFILLAKVVEKLSGTDFYEYQQKHIFNSAGMNATVYFSPDKMPAHTAHAYVPDSTGKWMEYDYGEETFFATRPDGGIYSTARDMLKWENALASGKILPDSILSMAYTPVVDVSSSIWCDYQRRPHTGYGLGWFIEQVPGHPVKVYHTGDNGGFQAYVAKYPRERVNIIVLENRNDRSRHSLATAIDSLLGVYK